MKTTITLLALCATLAVSRGDTVIFNLSPAGTDAAIGLSPANETPAILNSTGSGNVISGGVSLQITNSTLSFAIGYGSAAGFTDLTGPATGLSINGPAPTNGVAPVLFDLGPFTFPAGNPALGGVIFGSLALSSSQVSNLLAGLDYIQIATATNASGEIRAQLIPAPNSGPTVICPADATVECTRRGIPLAATVADANGDALSVVWAVNGGNVSTNLVPQGAATNGVDVVLQAHLPLGTNTVTVTVSDTASNQASCSSTIIVQDTIPPVIKRAEATPNVLWPPNGKMVPIDIDVFVHDECCVASWKIISVTSNEPVGSGNGNGGGDNDKTTSNKANSKGKGSTPPPPPPDWIITGDHGLSLRANREGGGSGRIYTITVQAQDCAGNLSAPVELTVTVPHDQGKK